METPNRKVNSWIVLTFNYVLRIPSSDFILPYSPKSFRLVEPEGALCQKMIHELDKRVFNVLHTYARFSDAYLF